MSGKQVPDRMLAHAARAKGTCDDFSVCRAFWSFWAPKGHDITTTKRIYDCRLRVSCIKEYKRLFNVLSVLKRYSPYSLQVNQRMFTCFAGQQWVRVYKTLLCCVQSNHVSRMRLIVKMVNKYVNKKFFTYICSKLRI